MCDAAAEYLQAVRLICVAAARGLVLTVLLTAAMVSTGAPALADSGIDNYARCVGGGAKPPPPVVLPENWFPSVHVIQNDFDSAMPPAEIVERLVTIGVDRKDTVTRVQCFVVYGPR